MPKGDVSEIIVSDTSILVDLERGNIEAVAFATRRLAVPDLLYQRELLPHGGERYLAMGLLVYELNEPEVALALEVIRGHRKLSLPDAFALVLAKSRGLFLITGDQALRDAAKAHGVSCHGILWLLDEAMKRDPEQAGNLHGRLTAISEHPRCRLPKKRWRDDWQITRHG